MVSMGHLHEATYRHPIWMNNGIEGGTCACGLPVWRPIWDGVTPADSRSVWTIRDLDAARAEALNELLAEEHLDQLRLDEWQRLVVSAQFAEDDHYCGAGYTTGGHDPYGTSCELPRRHKGSHRGADPYGNGGQIEWEGGGMCAGDTIPYRNVVRWTAEQWAEELERESREHREQEEWLEREHQAAQRRGERSNLDF